jgi:hypothetical protein
MVTRLSSAISPSCSRAWASSPRWPDSRYRNSSAPRDRSCGSGVGRAAPRTPAGHGRRASAAPGRRIHGALAADEASPPLPSRAASQTPGRNENAAAASRVARPRCDRRVQLSVPGLAATEDDGHSVVDGPDRLGPSHLIGIAAAMCGAHLLLLAERAHGSTTRRSGQLGKPVTLPSDSRNIRPARVLLSGRCCARRGSAPFGPPR